MDFHVHIYEVKNKYEIDIKDAENAEEALNKASAIVKKGENLKVYKREIESKFIGFAFSPEENKESGK